MDIRIATQNECAQFAKPDHHISTQMLAHKIDQGEILVAMEYTVVIGWLRHASFWDATPFMNLLTVVEE